MTVMNRVAACVLLVLSTVGCDSRPPTQPGALVPPSQSGPVIAGQVYDTALRPLAGVRLEVVDGQHAGLSTVTDEVGHYVLTGLFVSPTTVRASKRDYADATKAWTCSGSSCNRIDGPILSFELRGLFPSVDLAGNYFVTLSADPACAELPSPARTRTYLASAIGQTTAYRVELAGDTFLDSLLGFSYNYIYANVAGDHVGLFLLTGEPSVVERISTNTYVAYSGTARTSTTAGASTITAALDGWIDFCALKQPMDPDYACPADQRADPTPSQPVTYARCESKNHQIVLTRRP